MGHYASEMRTAAEQAAIDKRTSRIDRLRELGFEASRGSDKWKCGLCFCIVEDDDAEKHNSWHDTVSRLSD